MKFTMTEPPRIMKWALRLASYLLGPARYDRRLVLEDRQAFLAWLESEDFDFRSVHAFSYDDGSYLVLAKY